MESLTVLLEEFIIERLSELAWQCEFCPESAVCEEKNDGPDTTRYCASIIRGAIKGDSRLEIPFKEEEQCG